MQQQPGINGFNAAVGVDPNQQQHMVSPTMPLPGNPMMGPMGSSPPGMLNPTNALSADIKDAMRSLRDSLAFSFQSLNLTLSTLNQTVSTVGTRLGRLTPDTNDLSRNQYTAVGPKGVYLGAMSAPMANYIGNNNFGSIFSHYAPYNVSPLEFYTERARELGLRSSNMALAAGGGLIEEIGNYGASMWAGRKILGAMGIGASGALGEMGAWLLGSPIGVAASVGLSYLTDPIIEYGTRHNRDVAAMRRMSPRMGSGFDLRQSQRAVGGIERLALRDTLLTNSLQPRMGLEGFMEMTMMGLQGNMFRGSSADDLIKQVSSASYIVKFLMGVMGSKDVREAMSMVKQLKDMGVNVFQTKDFARSLGLDAFGYGRAMGVDSSSLLNSAANMSMAAYGQFGNPAFLGIRSGMRNLAYMQEMEKRGILSAADLAAGGGAQSIGARMIALEAGMQNSWHVGMPMLYAGWDGKTGFDQSKFKETFRGSNYFGALGSAMQNVLGGGINNLTSALMNRNNIMVSAANQVDANGNPILSANTKQMLASIIMMLPGMQNFNDPIEKRINTAAYWIKQIGPSEFGVEVDDATAKAMARDILQPSFGNRVQSIKEMREMQGRLEYVSASRGIGRWWESIGETVEKIKARAHEGLIGSAARPIADWTANTFEYLHGNPWAENSLKFNNNNIANYLWSKENMTDKYSRRMDMEDLEDVMDRLQDPDSLVHAFSRAFNPRINRTEDLMAYNDYVDTYDMYAAMNDPDKLNLTDFAIKYHKQLGNMTLKELRKRSDPAYFRKADKNGRYDMYNLSFMGNSGNAHAPLYLAAGALTDTVTPEMNAERERLNKLYLDTFGNMSVFSEQGKASLIGADGTFSSGLTANDVFTKVMLDGKWSNYINPEYLKQLKPLNENERAFVMATETLKYASDKSLRNGDASLPQALVKAIPYSMIKDLAIASGSPTNSFQRLMFKDRKFLDLSRMNDMDYFAQAGISSDEISNLFSAATPKDLERLAQNIGQLASFEGNFNDMTADELYKLENSGSEVVDKLTRKLRESAGTGYFAMRAIEKNSNLKLDGLSKEQKAEAATAFGLEKLKHIGNKEAENKAFDILTNAGLSDITAANAVSKVINIGEILEGLDKETLASNYQLGSAAETYKHLKGMSNSFIDRYMGLKKGTTTDANRDDHLRTIILNELGNNQLREEKANQDAANTKKSAVDAAIDMSYAAGPAMRVIEIDDVKKERVQVNQNTYNTTFAASQKYLLGQTNRYGKWYTIEE